MKKNVAAVRLIIAVKIIFVFSFTPPNTRLHFRRFSSLSKTSRRYDTTSIVNQEESNPDDKPWVVSEDIRNLSDIGSKFTIHVCTSVSCTQRRRDFGLDEYFLLTSLYERMEGSGTHGIKIEESNCLGQCKKGPCVSVEHDDYEGAVALEGMKPMEFNRRWY